MKAAFRSLGRYILLCYFFSPGIYPRGVVGLGTYGRYAGRGGDQGARLTLSSSTGSTTFLDHEASGGTPLISASSYAWLPPLPLFLRVRLFFFLSLTSSASSPLLAAVSQWAHYALCYQFLHLSANRNWQFRGAATRISLL
ncbi:hypothetical protein QBC33DRAFT_160688 [Phialemonium atrogriseum]|uniref:Uncharacterized protein n=1 Tax=Phialemonium atrogriseum TaxID=1093897 RepID=A0AAJ0CAJ3_9PEZI|nr:uncharacterized protein QBC33DRAFT_160688 [Phialemonium atrogriseum]KAK1771664.1 hypothetical protein QBC33DRAFT_160688 [Phialemonium atrogriseum]